MEIERWEGRTGIPNLEGNELVVHHHLLRQKIGADRGLVLIAELLVDILVHQAGLTDAAVAQDDDLQQNLLSRGHVWSWSLKKDSKADGCSLVSLLFLKKKSWLCRFVHQRHQPPESAAPVRALSLCRPMCEFSILDDSLEACFCPFATKSGHVTEVAPEGEEVEAKSKKEIQGESQK
jgi:hypothetical protein